MILNVLVKVYRSVKKNITQKETIFLTLLFLHGFLPKRKFLRVIYNDLTKKF